MEPTPAHQQGAQNGNGKVPPTLPIAYQPQIPESNQDGDDWDLQLLLQMLQRRGWVIGAIALSVVLAITLYTLKQVKIYQGEFQLLVEPINKDQDKLSQLTETLGEINTNKSGLDYDTQIEVLSSEKILLPIISKINSSCGASLQYDSLVETLKITRKEETKILLTSYQDPNPQTIDCVLKELSQGYISYSQQERQSTIFQGVKFVEEQLPEIRGRVDKLQAQLQAFRQRYNILDPQIQAEQLANRLTVIEGQRVESLVRLNEIRSLYSTLQAQLGVSPDKAIAFSALSESPRYQKLLDQLQDVEAQIASELARFNENSPTVQALRDKQRNLLPLLRQEATRVLGKNSSPPTTTAAKGNSTSPSAIRSNLSQQLVESANQIKVLEVRVAGINQAQVALQRQIQQMPLIARQYTDLQRELTVATESLNRFLGVKENLQIEAAQKELPWQLLAAPIVFNKPVSPNIPRNIVLGVIAGLLLGMGVALTLERLDNVFHSLDELKDRTRLPLLGTIPYDKDLAKGDLDGEPGGWLSQTLRDSTQDTKKRSHRYHASPFLESFRSLQTNISFLGSDNPVNSVVISSATPGDGKSTVSCNLAQAAAAMGQRVLLVDADMRRPRVHEVLGLENQTGLSNLLATDIYSKQAMQVLPGWDNLHVITAGDPLPPDPTRLLGSHKMHQLMQELESEFDLVIYDTPPVLGLADGRLLVPHTAGLILVVKLGKTDRSAVKETLDLMRLSSANVLGVVANGTRGKANSAYYYDKYYTKPEKDTQIEQAKQLLQKSLKKDDSSEKED
ncbi:GumC family protein [Merismopedia glauca]|uniref:Protein tyrosine kinase n=1 Tax=Merismopedia glauca CCAP 1448/3 TaxID=1296344 RepID=A0A2T1C769_9CYAN|nr:polysaccharide biosynthesis tyrosine autokinase [Merismopedia glauca]PSB04101.1 protein tyrosine kinase [Merismopedia glauca CCAP 1448/3]